MLELFFAAMKVKIKVQPEDFIVEELGSLPVKAKGSFGVYLLKKRGWNTVELLLKLSRELGIPFGDFSYGGRKDRYGLTTQYITIKNSKVTPLQEKNYSLKFLGWMERPMGPDLIEGNNFTITVRNLSDEDIQDALGRLESVKVLGYPNYFDDQRFGSFDSRQGFLAEKIIKAQFNGALKIYLTSIRPEDKKEEKERKQIFFENWRSWELCGRLAKTKFEKKAFDFLIKHPKGFLALLKEIPKEQMSFFFASYQSYLWNEVLRRTIRSIAPFSLKVYPGCAGEYIFYADLKKQDHQYLKDLKLPTPAAKVKMPDSLSEDIYEQVLKDNGIKNSRFNKLKLRQAFFKSFERSAIVSPGELTFNVASDRIYHGKKELLLKFSLPRGSYATMLVKRIF